MVEGIRMQRLFRSRLRISIAERPSQPKGARHAAPLVASTVLPPGPVLSITGGPYNVTAGETAQFTGSANCSNPTCTYGWAVTCPPFLTIGSQTATAAGINASITTGPNNGTVTHQINTFGLATPLVCNVSFSGTGASPLEAGQVCGGPSRLLCLLCLAMQQVPLVGVAHSRPAGILNQACPLLPSLSKTQTP